MKVTRFEDFEVWKLSSEAAITVYNITNDKDFSKDFGLRDQIRRAVVSISSNIAEGYEMNNNNDFVRYLRIAKGSCGEVRSQLFIAKKLGYLQEAYYFEIISKLEIISQKLGKFIYYLIDKKTKNEFITRNTLTR